LNNSIGSSTVEHKNLVIEKLAEEEAKRKIKGEAKKENLMVILNFKLIDFHDIPIISNKIYVDLQFS